MDGLMRAHRLFGIGVLVAASAEGCSTQHFEAGDLPPAIEGFAPPALNGDAFAAETPPAPLSGGTLGVVRARSVRLSDSDVQLWVVASIPEVDQIAILPFTGAGATTPSFIALSKGDEPGRVASDTQGRAHVVL